MNFYTKLVFLKNKKSYQILLYSFFVFTVLLFLEVYSE